ncbi:PEP2 [Pieris rapae granulovirus Wuhan]|uniref:PEP2 n=1 Tax=Pieris rapae granulovirus Wuhan TaxID=2848030 RepID=D2J4I9_9BBAC|nr:PEP2 [Betabaculovirus arrapae]ACZ63508.1 PEP2 [Betabaculovirus arrapae]ADO85447.1 pep [Pieris rapae granulovirus]AGS18785.1 PEP2 [Pieris rapae granulovirus]UOS85696.1 PEP2 [Pieris rapae granulovirus]
MSYSCLFCKPFDGINVPLMFVDMTLWVGADETLRILKLSSQTLSCLPDCEKTIQTQLDPCCDSKKCFITALGVGLLCNWLINRGCLKDNMVSNDLPECANAFANIFLTDIIQEIRTSRLLCSISKKEDAILDLLNEPTTPPLTTV